MSFFYNLIIQPIECIIGWLFCFTQTRLSAFGVGGVLVVSLVVNCMCLPLYNLADRLQKKERQDSARLAPYVKHIRRTFRGDERFMMLSELYRISGYRPIYALRSSLSIMLEIPFFIAAYHYLHNCRYLENVAFWIIPNLSEPDALLGGINLLPIAMTAINIVSGLIYADGSTPRERMQLMAMAGVFLVLLYPSPSGLVLYWIFNNIFSLCKNIVSRTGHGRVVLYSLAVIFFSSCSFYLYKETIMYFIKVAVILLTCLVALLPLELRLLRRLIGAVGSRFKVRGTTGQNSSVMILAGLALAIMAGFVLPSTIVASSPAEFSFLGGTDNPTHYVFRTFTVFLGFFVVWPSVIYFSLPERYRALASIVMTVLCFSAALNIFVFSHNYGIINNLFNLDDVTSLRKYPAFLTLLPLVLTLLFMSVSALVRSRFSPAIAGYLLLSICVGGVIFATTKLSKIKKEYAEYKELHRLEAKSNDAEPGAISPIFSLSKNGRNIVVLFLDRAVSSFFPYVVDEMPELRDKFRGFVYYPNSLSFSRNTDNASPAMMGGYEYIPRKLNERTNMTLREKQNEANLVMPEIFSRAGYDVFVVNPPLSNYMEHGDLSPFAAFPDVHATETYGKYISAYKAEKHIDDSGYADIDDLCKSGMIDFCFMRLLYPPLRFSFYENCRWRVTNEDAFYDVFSGLYYLPELTGLDSEKSTYTFIGSDVTHTPNYLDENYERVASANNRTCKYPSSTPIVLRHYHVFAAAMRQLAKWFDFLRDNGIYDNTRIVIVADHGYDFSVAGFPELKDTRTLTKFNALLLFKDFDSDRELSSDRAFMTNADTPFLSSGGLELELMNPFTGNVMRQEKDGGIDVYPTYGLEWSPGLMRDRTQFTLSDGFHVSGDIFDRKNWKPID